MSIKTIGALWEAKEGATALFTGEISLLGEPIKIQIYKNTYKKEDRHPDYNICRIIGENKNKKSKAEDAPLPPDEGF